MCSLWSVRGEDEASRRSHSLIACTGGSGDTDGCSLCSDHGRRRTGAAAGAKDMLRSQRRDAIGRRLRL